MYTLKQMYTARPARNVKPMTSKGRTGDRLKRGEKRRNPTVTPLKESLAGDICRLNLKQLVQQDAGDKLKWLVDSANCPESRFKGWLTDLLTDWQTSRIKSILCLCSKSSSVVQPVGQKGSFPYWHTKNNLKQHYCRRNKTQINMLNKKKLKNVLLQREKCLN